MLDPLYALTGAILAFFYALVPSYAFAIVGVTLVMLSVLTPLTWRGLRSGIKMQKLMPEMKRLQQEYKADRQALNEELMKLYKEHNVTPLGGCVPFLVQSPFFFALFGTLRGMSRVVHAIPQDGVKPALWPRVAADTPGAVPVGLPQHLPDGSAISHSLTGTKEMLGHAPGEVKSLGFDLARSASEMASEGFTKFLPYLLLLVLMIGLSYFAQIQVSRRNPAAAAANPQLQIINKVFPFVFGITGWAFQAGVTLYWAASSLLRIVQQMALFRFDPALAQSVEENRRKVHDDLRDKDKDKKTTNPPEKRGLFAKPAPEGLPSGNGAPQGKSYTPPKGRPTGRQQPKKKRKK